VFINPELTLRLIFLYGDVRVGKPLNVKVKSIRLEFLELGIANQFGCLFGRPHQFPLALNNGRPLAVNGEHYL
jgi:hypothetical protein